MSGEREAVKRVLVYRLGALGDTLIALPSFRLIRRAYPQAEIRLLTVGGDGDRYVANMDILKPMGLVDGAIFYQEGERSPFALAKLVRQVRRFAPEEAVYLLEPRTRLSIWRDWFFLRVACGIPKIHGLPFSKALFNYRALGGEIFEHESHRLARRLFTLGDAHIENLANYDFDPTETERAKADVALKDLPHPERGFVAVCVGARGAGKDWGDEKWAMALQEISAFAGGRTLVCVGAPSEAEHNERLARNWSGPVINLSGRLTPRESGTVLGRADLYLGYDSGAMHLAASQRTPVVSLYTGLMARGTWTPIGLGHAPLYPEPLEAGMRSIQPERMIEAARRVLVS